MKNITLLILSSFIFLTHPAYVTNIFASQDTSYKEQKIEAVKLVPEDYQPSIIQALSMAEGNARELTKAILSSSETEREGMAFLIANMPQEDLKTLKASFLINNVKLAYMSLQMTPWGENIPKNTFLNYVLPYAVVNETRESVRSLLYKRFMSKVSQFQTIEEAVLYLNEHAFDEFGISYHATQRIKPDQSPLESIKLKVASCTGLSIFLTSVLRSVGIPSRLVATPNWINNQGNHTWVEVWVNGEWAHIGAAEPAPLNEAWFNQIASKADPKSIEHAIYAASFKKTDLPMPLAWAKDNNTVYATNVTQRYNQLPTVDKEPFAKARAGLTLENFFALYPKTSARTYRKEEGEEWITYNFKEDQDIHLMTFYFKNDQLVSWKKDDREEVVKEYLSEYCSQSFIQFSHKIYTAIVNALNGIPHEVFISLTDRQRPVLFTEYHYSGMGRFANSSEIISFEDDAPSFENGMTIIKLSTELELVEDGSAIQGIVLHELAHRYLEHAKNKTEVCAREKEANNLVKTWGFEQQFLKAKESFGNPEESHTICP